LRALVESTSARAIDLANRLALELPARPGYTPIPALADYWDERDAAVAALQPAI
jgi:hypothetical protein